MAAAVPTIGTDTKAHVQPALAEAVLPNLIERLLEARRRTPLQRGVSLTIARQWPANQLPSIKRAFEALDSAGTGQLHKAKLRACLRELGVDCDLAREIAEALDMDRNGLVDWTEFVSACIHPGSHSLEEDLRRLFEQADKDDDGLLSMSDLASLLATEHLRSGEAIRDALQDVIDADDPSARISWQEFRAYFCDPSGSAALQARKRAAAEGGRGERRGPSDSGWEGDDAVVDVDLQRATVSAQIADATASPLLPVACSAQLATQLQQATSMLMQRLQDMLVTRVGASTGIASGIMANAHDAIVARVETSGAVAASIFAEAEEAFAGLSPEVAAKRRA